MVHAVFVRDRVGDVPFTWKTPINYLYTVQRVRPKNSKYRIIQYRISYSRNAGNKDDPDGFEKYFLWEVIESLKDEYDRPKR